ncbi:MAG: FliH/SctL family protein [Myxococcaceae bacterium]
MGTSWSSTRPRARILPAPLLAARDRAHEVLAAAEAQAAERIAEAEQQADALRSDACGAGRDEGLAYAQRLMVEMQQQRLRVIEGQSLARTASELALAMTRRVLGEAWATEPGTWARALLAAAAPLRRAEVISLHVSTASATAVRAALSAEVDAGTVEVVEDSAVDEAGCVAVSGCGKVDGRLSTMLAAFRGPLGLEAPG